MKKEDSLIKYGKKCNYLFSSFISWILNECKKENIEEIYFFTREGEFFKSIFDKINDSNIISNTLEVSRIATFFASLRDISIQELKRLWNQYTTQDINSFFKSLDLDINKYHKYLKIYDIAPDKKIEKPWKNEKIVALFNDKKFIKELKLDQEYKRKEICLYLKNKKITNSKGKIAIVDIGWRGTIQDNLCYLIPNKTIYGYYFGLIDFINEQPKNSKKVGYINEFNKGIEKIIEFPPLEMICNSPNGSVINYSNGIAIRKKDIKENYVYNKYIQYFQKGVLESANLINNVKDIKSMEILLKIINNPNYQITEAFFNLNHNEEFGLGKFVKKEQKITTFDILKSFFSKNPSKQVNELLKETTWTQGYIKYKKINILNIYLYLNKKRKLKI